MSRPGSEGSRPTAPGTPRHPVADALSFLLARQLANRVRGVRKRLREPRYLVGALAGIAYFGAVAWVLLRDPDVNSLFDAELLLSLAAPLMALFAIAWWAAGKSHTSLAFDPAEVQLLFQAPITRPALVRYKLIKAQGGILVAVFFFTVFLGHLASIPLPLVALSIWIVLATVHLHQMAAALVRTRWAQAREQGSRPPWLAAGLFGGWILLLGAGFAGLVPALREAGSFERAWYAFLVVRANPAAMLALLPAEVLLAPLGATDLVSWGWAASGALGLLVLHYFWVLQTNAAFEETAAQAGEEAAALVNAAKQGRLLAYQLSRRKRLPAPWFGLGSQGHPAFALFWKNFTSFTRAVHPAFVWVLLLVFVGVYVLLLVSEGPREAGLATAGITAALAAYSILLGPMAQRNDLRSDLQRVEMLRTYPLGGASVAIAQVASSTVGLTLVQTGLLLLSLIFVLLAAPPLPYPWLPAAGFVAAVICCAPLNALGLALQNLLAVLFPAWYQLGPSAKQGADAIGGGLVLFLLSAVLMALGLLAPVAIAAGIGFALWPSLGIAAAAPALGAALGVLGAEIVALVAVLGRVYEDLDPIEAGLLR